ncbi:unnamed protein product, partial [Dibothriocephalus latus]
MFTSTLPTGHIFFPSLLDLTELNPLITWALSVILDLILLALNHRCQSITDSRPNAPQLCFAPRESVTIGCHLADTLVNLLNHIEDLQSLGSLPTLLSLLVRCQELLQKLANADPL